MKDNLDTALESLKALCEPVAPPKDTLAFMRYFVAEDTLDKTAIKENEQKRKALYKYATAFIRAYTNLANEMEAAGYTRGETEEIIRLTKYYDKIRNEIMHASGEYIDLKTYEGDMRHLIDSYISAKDSKQISAFNDMSLVELIVAQGAGAVDSLPEGIKNDKEATAETIENNVRKLIIEETPTNPKYYEKMSVLLDEIIKLRREQAINYKEYLAQVIELTKKTKDPRRSGSYPKRINSGAKRAIYDNLDEDEELVLKIDKDLIYNRPDGWRGNVIKERRVKYIIGKYLRNDEIREDIFEIIKNQGEY
jgi:type I restriction enzyme R subunit